MDRIKFRRFVELEEAAQGRLRHLSTLMLHTVRDCILLTETTVGRVKRGAR